ncbi:DUF4908 domain-containing protein [Brevundimonas sp. R86498]|uniref:DUF4908 domain-containing protein n=1 Tax=Brevundimonas sp. R86498 TaxID=3093845 RepID=UPI0037C62E4F
MRSRVKVEAAIKPIPAALAVAAAAALACLVGPTTARAFDATQARANAQAEQSRAISVRPSLSGAPPSGRYMSESGEPFIFDGTRSRPLFRFERRTETWVLRPTPAPRGDIIYRNDAGAQVLRVTPGGGVTLYTQRAPNGSPASLVGGAAPLVLPPLGPIGLFSLMNQRGSQVSQALGRLVVINLSGDQSEELMVDALMVTTEAVIRMARSPTWRDELNTLRSITLLEGDRASVTFRRGDLLVVVNPAQELEGRPSSSTIIRAVSRDD